MRFTRTLLLLAPLLLVAVAAVGADSMAPGIQIRVNSTYQGYVTWSDTIYFSSFTGVGTGDIIDFSQASLGAGGDVWPRMGICSDDIATNITIAGLTDYSLTYNWMGAGGAVRIWCPDKHQPTSIDGGILSGWDDTYQVATIMPTNDHVVVHWTQASVIVDYSNFFDAFLLLSLVPIIMGSLVVIGVVSGKMGADNAAAIAIIIVAFAIAGSLAVIVLNALLSVT